MTSPQEPKLMTTWSNFVVHFRDNSTINELTNRPAASTLVVAVSVTVTEAVVATGAETVVSVTTGLQATGAAVVTATKAVDMTGWASEDFTIHRDIARKTWKTR